MFDFSPLKPEVYLSKMKKKIDFYLTGNKLLFHYTDHLVNAFYGNDSVYV
jgi:hypothetical protein